MDNPNDLLKAFTADDVENKEVVKAIARRMMEARDLLKAGITPAMLAGSLPNEEPNETVLNPDENEE